MRILRSVFLFSCLLFLLASAGSGESKQQKDFAIFREVLLAKESTLDLHVPESTIERAFQLAEKNFDRPLSLLEQFKIYSLTLAVIQCGHTQIHPNNAVFKEWLTARKSLPIDYYLLGKRLIVGKLLQNDIDEMQRENPFQGKEQDIPAGAEILSIDHLTVPEMMSEMALFMPSDENGMDFRYFQASQLFEFYRHVALPFDEDTVAVSYIFKGDTQTVSLAVGRAPVYTINERLFKSAKAYKEESDDFGKFKIEQGCGYFRFKTFKISHGKKYDAFLESSFKQLKRRRIKKLIVDLRGNTGGAMQFSIMRYFVGEDVYLGRYVVGKPKQGIENTHLKKWNVDYGRHRVASRQQKRKIRKGKFDEGRIMTEKVDTSLIYKGKIVVITDEGTFSSAGILAGHLKTLCGAKIVGSPAGGSFYSGNAGTLLLVLPNSKLKVYVNPNTFYSQLTNTGDPFAVKQPDIALQPLISDDKKRDKFYFKAAKGAFQ